MTDVTTKPGDVARYIACQAALVRTLNDAINRLAEVGCGGSAQLAAARRDEALALSPGDPND